MYPRRMAPYPNPSVHMNQKRQQQPQVQIPQQMNAYSNPNMQPGYSSGGPPQVGRECENRLLLGRGCNVHVSDYFGLAQFPNGYTGSRGGMVYQGQFPGQQPNMTAMNSYNPTMPMQGGGPVSRGAAIRQSTPPYAQSQMHQNGGGPMQSHQYFMPNGGGIGPGGGGGGGGGGQYPPPNNNQFQQEVTSMRPGSYQHSPIPVGNPTPPLTPASNMPPYVMSPSSADIKPNVNELKPNILAQSEYGRR